MQLRKRAYSVASGFTLIRLTKTVGKIFQPPFKYAEAADWNYGQQSY
jgi:hypothetical protein